MVRKDKFQMKINLPINRSSIPTIRENLFAIKACNKEKTRLKRLFSSKVPDYPGVNICPLKKTLKRLSVFKAAQKVVVIARFA